ncbi:flagellar biosynthesis protein [Microbacterium sp. CH12i]|uniref:sugar-transfer associated ATP-grasp domain-containing protein n=1 Tax=Microbacterium sp. CH12i TaxID=1479651 RepID=UPI0004620717|nr:sugar-transfer associated ATP-grasp domain-containing protein [Microbacterium sp. CH12i]KDA05593.1 flagellar biosynthesis protein [Microbacterium sp. CH12i]
MSRDVALKARVKYLFKRLTAFNPGRVWSFATQIAEEQGKWAPKIFVDMLIWAAFHDTAYIDYYEADFALLTRRERKTFMTSLIQHHLANALNNRTDVLQFENKLTFNRRFGEYLGREWMDLEDTDAEHFRAFAKRHPVIIAKMPVGREGKGVFRYDTAEISDWATFRAELIGKGQNLIEQPIVQHPYLAGYCAGTVNTTRVATFFDGTTVHVLMAAQKFGRGAVSDQFTWGGFFTMLDENGHSVGPGHTGKHKSRYETHPDSGASITEFQVPMWDQVMAIVDRAAREVATVPYIGWDVVVGPDAPLLIEGNWTPGLYETRVSATGIRTGSRARHQPVIEASRR